MGEMERDNMLAWGATAWLRDAFAVDSVEVHLCRRCGTPCIAPGPRVVARAHCDRPSCIGAGAKSVHMPKPMLVLFYLLAIASVEMRME